MVEQKERNKEQHRVHAIQWAAGVSVAGNALLALGKILGGVFFSSFAVLGDGLDSVGDVVSSLLTLFTAAILIRPPDFDHPYGHQRADTITSKILSFIIFFTGAQFSLSTITQFLERTPAAVPSIWAMVVAGISVLGKLALSVFLKAQGKKHQSKMLEANAKNMRSDIIISLVVLLGLFFSTYVELGVIDVITGFVVGLWIMKTAVEIFIDTNMELMDGMRDPSIYFRVFDAVETVPGAKNPHRARIRRQGPWYIIDLDIEVDGSLSVIDAHKICQKVEQSIRGALPNVYDIMVHMEPLGNVEEKEKYGLDRESLSQ